MTKVDWEALARRAGCFVEETAAGASRGVVGPDQQSAALVELLGEDVVRSAVRHAAELGPGAALAEQVVAIVGGRVAQEECLRIYREASDPTDRRLGLRLLSDCGDAAVLPALRSGAGDADAGTRATTAWVLFQLVMKSRIDVDEALDILGPLTNDADAGVREQARHVVDVLAAGECLQALHRSIADDARWGALIALIATDGESDGPPPDLSLVQRCRAHPGANVRQLAAWLAFKLAHASLLETDDAMAVLTSLTADADDAVRARATRLARTLRGA